METKNICVYGSSSAALDETYYRAAYELGQEIAKAGYGLVFGGGNMGVMGAAARGAKSAGGRIIGILPKFMAEVVGVPYPDCDDMIITETMRERKQNLEDLADAFVTAPGGIGTFEEFYEILTLKQLKRHKKAIVLLNTLSYYDDLIHLLEHSVSEKFMAPNVMDLFTVAGTSKEAVDAIVNYTYQDFADKWTATKK